MQDLREAMNLAFNINFESSYWACSANSSFPLNTNAIKNLNKIKYLRRLKSCM